MNYDRLCIPHDTKKDGEIQRRLVFPEYLIHSPAVLLNTPTVKALRIRRRQGKSNARLVCMCMRLTLLDVS